MSILKNLVRGVKKIHARQKIVTSGFWFVDIPRTSSSSIREWLFNGKGYPHGKNANKGKKNIQRQYFPDHTTAREVLGLVGRRNWDKLYTFTFVRNPFDRFASLFLYYKFTEKLFLGDFREFCEFFVGLRRLPEHKKILGSICNGQHEFLTDSQGRVAVSEVFHFEERGVAINKIAEKIKISPSLEDNLFQSIHKPAAGLRTLYDKPTAEIIRQECAKDFSFFGYSQAL